MAEPDAPIQASPIRTARVRTATPDLPAGGPGRGCGRGRRRRGRGVRLPGHRAGPGEPAGTGARPGRGAPAGAVPRPVPAGILPQSQRQTAVISFNATADGRAELHRPVPDDHRAGQVPDRGRQRAAGGHRSPAVRLGRARTDRGAGRPRRDGRGGVHAVRRLVRAGPPTTGAGQAQADDRVPRRRPGPGAVRRRPGGSAQRGQLRQVVYALRDIARHTRGGMQARWRIDGFSSPARPSGPFPATCSGSWTASPTRTPTGPRWTAWSGSSRTPRAGRLDRRGQLFVVRLIRMLVEFWNRVDVTEQENMIGRRRATGYPLDANSIQATPDFAADPTGEVIPLTSHIRLANPRTAESADSRILRRATTTTAASTRSATWTSGWSSRASSRI